jgi:hypothetical protein
LRILGVLVVVGATAGCGRVGFEAVGDGGSASVDATPIADHACNTVMVVGVPLPAISTTATSERWIATMPLPAGIVFAQTTASGTALFPIDFTQSPPVLGAAVIASTTLGNNLQVAASRDRVLTSSSMAGQTVLAITSLALAPIVARTEAALAVSGPDHAVADGAGGWVVASSAANMTHLDRITADGGFVSGGMWPFANVRAGTLAAAGPGRYVAVWDPTMLGTCPVRVVDDSLAEIASTTITGCQFARVAATADRIAVSYYTGAAGLSVITLSADLAQRSAAQPFLSGQFNPSRSISADDGFWTISPLSATAARVNHATPQGTPETERPIVPFTSDTVSYNYDVVTVQGRAYAVWLDAVTGSPSLYVERLCGS